jgi:hypothetical protein
MKKPKKRTPRLSAPMISIGCGVGGEAIVNYQARVAGIVAILNVQVAGDDAKIAALAALGQVAKSPDQVIIQNCHITGGG